MKLAPVSGDLVVKLALGGAALLALVYAAKRVRDSLPSISVPDWSTFDPTSDQNALYQATNGVISAGVGYDETLGGWLYDITHRDPTKDPLPNVSGTTGPGADNSTGQTFSWGF